MKVPLHRLPDEQWRSLRRIAYQTAAFGNALLSEQYAAAKGLQAEWKTYVGHNTLLSAAVRDAVGREVLGIWRREGKKILRGEQTLGRFSADRALVCRDRGVRLVTWGGGNLAFHLRLEPKPAALQTLRVDMHAVRHWKHRYLRELLQKLSDKEYPITKASVVFQRPGRKAMLFVTYSKPVLAATADHTRSAVLIVLSDGTCRLQSNGQALTLTDRIYRLVAQKEHYARIHARIRVSLGKAGRRRENRRALRKAGSFEKWAHGQLHQLSHRIVEWCQAHGVGLITWQIDEGAPVLPWQELQQQVAYKAEEWGIGTTASVSQTSPVAEQKKGLRKNPPGRTQKGQQNE